MLRLTPAGARPRREPGGRIALVPGCGRLPERSLPSAGIPISYLLTPIPDGAALAEHIHPRLTIVVDGRPQTIPAGIGLLASGALPIHTHTSDGRLHVESTRRLPFTLGDFFTVRGRPFTRNNVLDHEATPGHPVRMTVNGVPSRAFSALVLKDHH